MSSKPIVKTANRACSLLYSYLCQQEKGTWLLPVNVCPDVPLTFCLAKVPFEFVDIDSSTLCIDEHECLRRIGTADKKYAGILYVRTYGYMSDVSSFFRQCKKLSHCICIIDDRCLCLPRVEAMPDDVDLILYSTGKCKQIDLGGGGLALAKNTFRLAKTLSYNGIDEQVLYKEAFASHRHLDSIPTGWLDIQENSCEDSEYIKKIERSISKRISFRDKINLIYTENLPLAVQFDAKFQKWRFNIKVPTWCKCQILEKLFENGLFASNHYHSANKLFDNRSFFNSDSLFDGTINLFNDYYYTEEKAMKTCEIINAFPIMGGKS